MTGLFAENLWPGLLAWTVLYVSDYWLTLHCARLYQQKVRGKLSFEGSYELNPLFQRDVDAGIRVSPRFIFMMLVTWAWLAMLWWLTRQPPRWPQAYAFLLGMLFLVELAIHVRHVRNLVLFQTGFGEDGVQGQMHYPRALMLRTSASEFGAFAGLYGVAFVVTGSPFLLGGAASAAALAIKHLRMARRRSPTRVAGATALLLAASAVAWGGTPAVERPRYSVRLAPGEASALEVSQDGQRMFRFPLVSGLSTPGEEEKLSNVRLVSTRERGESTIWEVTAQSSLWTARSFRWTFSSDRIEFQHFASGPRPIERCYFLSNGISERWANGTSPGVFANTTVYATRYFSPRPNHADQSTFTIAMPQSLGVAGEAPDPPGFHPVLMGGIFAPPPLFLAFERNGLWAGIGLGTEPGGYQFNGLEYSGSRYAGASFWVHYGGYRTAAPQFASPRVSIHFGYSEWDAMARYVGWMDESGFATRKRFPNAPWHRRPIFCGWAEQTREAAARGLAARDLATQAKYEEWLAVLESRGLPIGTIVIDDKWQRHYGAFDVDEQKWPDLQGFVARQHARGRRVLLWVPAFHREGLPDDLCVKVDGQPVAGDVSNPAYESFLRERVRHLVADLGVDGFKEDWLGGLPPTPGLQAHGWLFGLEFVRRFQFLLHDEAHRWKPDALVETQTPNPLFRESSDVLRLNDLWYGARDVPEIMRRRARIARTAGWDLVDCDNASSTNLEEWWSYMREQPSIGIPALYFVHRTESTLEEVPEGTWRQLAAIWDAYVKGLADSP